MTQKTNVIKPKHNPAGQNALVMPRPPSDVQVIILNYILKITGEGRNFKPSAMHLCGLEFLPKAGEKKNYL